MVVVEVPRLDMSLEVTISKGLCQSSRDFWVCVHISRLGRTNLFEDSVQNLIVESLCINTLLV